MTTDRGKPLYMIGVVAEMLKVHPQTLRFYEKKGLVRPSRTEGQTRMYSAEDVDDIARLLRLTRDLGVNLAGVEIILNMRDRMSAMEKEVQAFMEFVRGQVVTYEADASRGQNAMVRVVPPRLIRSLSRQGEHHPAAESDQSHSSQLSAATRKP